MAEVMKELETASTSSSKRLVLLKELSELRSKLENVMNNVCPVLKD
jgi:hypothetical protein